MKISSNPLLARGGSPTAAGRRRGACSDAIDELGEDGEQREDSGAINKRVGPVPRPCAALTSIHPETAATQSGKVACCSFVEIRGNAQNWRSP